MCWATEKRDFVVRVVRVTADCVFLSQVAGVSPCTVFALRACDVVVMKSRDVTHNTQPAGVRYCVDLLI